MFDITDGSQYYWLNDFVVFNVGHDQPGTFQADGAVYAKIAGSPFHTTITLDISSDTPEPSAFALVGLGLVGACWLLRRRRRV